MKKIKLEASMNEYTKNIEKRMEFTEVFAYLFFMVCMGINYLTIKSDAVAVTLLLMGVLTKIMMFRVTKKHIQKVHNIGTWRAGKHELEKSLEDIQSHISFLKSAEAKRTFPPERLKAMLQSYTQAERTAKEGIEHCSQVAHDMEDVVLRTQKNN
jgi:hypothetical protein